ncbi:MAG: ferritin-like domain-containing protein [Nocardioidaceae bacterium]
MGDAMEVAKVQETLGNAIDLQAESVLTMSLLAGSLRGVEATAIRQSLREFVLAELEDTNRLIEKLSALGGNPSMRVPDISTDGDTQRALKALLRHEAEAVAALHAVIPHSGQQPRSEALEHLLEHCIMRKQQQIDFLWHATDLKRPIVVDPNG